jgi:hypothetical protein
VARAGLLTLAFDGANIWLPNGNTVTKMRASDGEILAVYNVGADGSGVAFDGVNLWLTAGPFIVELRPSDGAVLLVKRLVGDLSIIAFDGANVWVAGYVDDSVFKL